PAGRLAAQQERLAVLDARGDLDAQLAIPHLEVQGAPQGCLQEGDGDLGLDRLRRLRAPGPAAPRPPRRGAAAHATPAAAELAEQLAGVGALAALEVEGRPAGPAAAPEAAEAPEAGFGAGGPELVVLGPLGLVTQDVVGVLDLLEPGLRLLVPGVAV